MELEVAPLEERGITPAAADRGALGPDGRRNSTTDRAEATFTVGEC